jgi:hypothetical protein
VEHPIYTGSDLSQPLFRARTHILVSAIAFSLLLAAFLATAATSFALTSGDVSINGMPSYAALDSNNPCTDSPRAMFVQANVKNTSASTLAGMSASFGGYTSTAIALAPMLTCWKSRAVRRRQ